MRLTRAVAIVILAVAAVPLFAASPAQTSLRDWINSPEAYFVTSEERALWDQTVSTDEKAKAFIDEYWQKRGDAFKREVMSRIEFADKQFGLGGIGGSRTAKGRIWMILGSPSSERTLRGAPDLSVPGGASLQNNTIEQRGRVTTQWVYRPERLPKEIGVPSLTVTFITDLARNFQNVDNLGQVEPALKKAAEFFARQHALAPTGREHAAAPAAPAAPGAPAGEDPLWKAQESAAGTFFTGEPYISPKEQAFYAVSFFVPKSAEPFAKLKSVLFVGLVKNAEGTTVANLREQADLAAYGDGGDRYVDRSVALPPGKYEGMFALFTPEGTTLLASRRAQLDVPALKATRASSVLLTSQIDTLEKQFEFDPFTFVAIKYAVKGNRQFRPAEKVGFFTVVANPSGDPEPSMTLRMIVSKDGKVLDRTPPEPAPLTQTGPHTWLIGTQFDANTFKPGHYSIEVQVRDMKADKASEAFTKGYVRTAEFDVVQ